MGVGEVWTCLGGVVSAATAVFGVAEGQACALTSYDSTSSVQLHTTRTDVVDICVATSWCAIICARSSFRCSTSRAHAHGKIESVNQTDVVKVLISGAVECDFGQSDWWYSSGPATVETPTAAVAGLTARSATSGPSPHSSGPVRREINAVTLSMEKFESTFWVWKLEQKINKK